MASGLNIAKDHWGLKDDIELSSDGQREVLEQSVASPSETQLTFFEKVVSHEGTKKSAYGLSTLSLGAGAGVAGFEVAVFFGAASPLLAIPGVGWAAFGVAVLVALVSAYCFYKTATTEPVVDPSSSNTATVRM